MTVSLFTVGNTHLGKASPVKLSELNTADSETRVYADDSDYKRVNSIEQGRNRAPAAGTTKTLSDWMDNGNPYVQWDTAANRGTEFKLTAGRASSDCGSPTTCTATFTWTRPTDYEDFPTSLTTVQQALWVYPCSPNSELGCENDNPFTGTANDNRYATSDVSPGTGVAAAEANNLNEDTWYTAAVRMEWNDEDTSDDPYKQLGIGYALHGTPGGDNTCADCASGGPAIIFETAVAPVCDNGGAFGISTSTDDPCGGCDACTDRASGGSLNPGYRDGGFPGSGTTRMYTNNSCSAVLGSQYKWIASNTDTAYAVSSGVVNNGNTVNCNSECSECNGL
jgi:hypothetical protein